LPAFLDLSVGFSRYFTVVPAVTDEQKRAAYRIRHDVYCRDLGFEAVHPQQLETDEFDHAADHCLLRAVANGQYVGCIRLVYCRRDDPQAPLPFERVCKATLDRRLIDPGTLPRDRIAEVSRLAVINAYRRRKGEAQVPASISDDDFGNAERPRFPYIPVGLYLGMLALARRRGIETLFVLTEPRLSKHLSRLGVDIRTIGGGVEHRGLRIPSMMSVERVIGGLNFLVRPLFEAITREVEAGYRVPR
jgi:N-acyl amino acid synthase of PEP-CTERM/exosortase system